MIHDTILIYDVSCKAVIGLKPLQIRFDEIYGIIRIYDGTIYLTLFRTKKLMLFMTKLDIF